MEMIITEIEYTNIRKIGSLKLKFLDDKGKLIKNTFIMMGNGTGKTTTITLLKGLLDGTAEEWESDIIESFRPLSRDVEKGEFSISAKFDERIYKYYLDLDYKTGVAKISCSTTLQGGLENGRRFPDAIKGLFTQEFVSRFIFDGEQAQKILDNESNEAEQAIRYLYRLDVLDGILGINRKILEEKQAVEGNNGTGQSIKNMTSRKEEIERKLKKLKEREKKLEDALESAEKLKKELEMQIQDLDRKFKNLNEEKKQYIEEKEENRKNMDLAINDIILYLKRPSLVNEILCKRMTELGKGMTKLKLPKNISKDFFVELSEEKVCICGNVIGKEEKRKILDNADRYLGSNQQSVLNSIKSSLRDSEYSDVLEGLFEKLEKLDNDAARIEGNLRSVEDRLIAEGGKKAEELRDKLGKIEQDIVINKDRLSTLQVNDASNPTLTEDNNIPKAQMELVEHEEKIASRTRTNKALKQKNIIEKLVIEIGRRVTLALKAEIIGKANEKLRKVITDDTIEIESIENFVKLKGKSGASEAQTLSVAYCFLGTLFEDSELQFPFIIDSPAGKMDYTKRRAVADILPTLFNQLVSFVTSAEVEQFADQFYHNSETQYITIVADSETDEKVTVYEGIEYFDTYQREHREEV